VVVMAGVLGACGGGGSGEGSGRPFASVKEMVAAMQSGGVRCRSLHESRDRIASDAGHCDVGGVTVNLAIYRSSDDVDRALTEAKGLVSSGAALVGPNWTAGAVGSRAGATVRKIRMVLGGEIEAL
jgi:hypothetical protein